MKKYTYFEKYNFRKLLGFPESLVPILLIFSNICKNYC